MFDLSDEEFLDIKRLSLIHLFHSLNQPQISPGAGQSPQPAEAFTMAFQMFSKEMVICIGLFFPLSTKRVLYKRGPFQAELLSEGLADAEAFTSQMGFLMTNLNFSSASNEEKGELLRTTPFFYEDVKLFFDSLSVSEIEVKKTQGESTSKKEIQADSQQLFFHQYVTMLSML